MKNWQDVQTDNIRLWRERKTRRKICMKPQTAYCTDGIRLQWNKVYAVFYILGESLHDSKFSVRNNFWGCLLVQHAPCGWWRTGLVLCQVPGDWATRSTLIFKLPQWLQVISAPCYLPKVEGFVMAKRKAQRNICCLSHDILVVKLKMFAIGEKKLT